MSGRWKWLWQALVWAIRVEYLRAPAITLIHDARILEFFNESFFSPKEENDHSDE
jgi:hypothetical protein